MKFGAFVPQGWRMDLKGIAPAHAQYQAMVGVAQQLESLNYDSLWLFDHFHTIPVASDEPTFECWMSTAALAASTKRIRLGQMVGCNMYRNPAVLAKMAATVDVISNGRLDFGLGAGWYESESIAYGFPFERPAVRIGQLDEALQIIKGMWTQPRFQFDGKFYRIGHGHVRNFRGEEEELKGAIVQPQPIQKPHPPVWVGGGGEQLTLKTVARHADYSNFFGLDLEGVKHKNDILDGHCRAAGRRPEDVHRTVGLEVMFGEPRHIQEFLVRSGWSAEEVERRMPRGLYGEAGAMIDKLHGFQTAGRIEYFIGFFPDAAHGNSIQRFAEEVMPALRGARVTRVGFSRKSV